MKAAVYTIALNEEQFVERWYESAKDADYLLIADTGSTDKTVEKALALGINVVHIRVKPWRFDDARNAALAALPEDIDMCVSLDMDEILTPNWREPLEKAFLDGVTRPRYKHIWNFNEDGTPGMEFAYDHVHSRHGYRWRHPVHECLYVYGMEEKLGWMDNFETHHHADNTKSRAQYLPLLALSVQEDPANDRNAFYYARELMYAGRNEEAAMEFKRHLGLPSATWPAERAQSLRFLAKVEPQNAEKYLLEAVATCLRREPLVDLAQLYHNQQNWAACLFTAKRALDIVTKPLDYLCEEFAWGPLPHDLAAVSAHWLGLRDEAIAYGKAALALSPNDERLKANVDFYQS